MSIYIKRLSRRKVKIPTTHTIHVDSDYFNQITNEKLREISAVEGVNPFVKGERVIFQEVIQEGRLTKNQALGQITFHQAGKLHFTVQSITELSHRRY